MEYESILIQNISKIVGKKISSTDSLINSRLIDSISLVDVLLVIEDEFKLTLHPQELTVENFDTVDKIHKYILSKLS